MNRIHLLPEQVANQIAAGEVVERPASVVKELVENSLDAGATRLHVEIVAAGRGLIRVTDDGCGMSRDDALLCFERHATSKITAAADLARIRTLGFRGEAVPSIASVSRLLLSTRERAGVDATTPGTEVVIHGGKILEVREGAAASGTTIQVRGLFYNVPARRKFLRSDETERGHIQHWLTTAALAHPQVAFTLVMEGRTVWQLPALPEAGSMEVRLQQLRERLRLLLGDGLLLVPVHAEGQLPQARVAPVDAEAPAELSDPAGVHVWGWIGAPGVSRGSREDQHLFVNQRPVDNRGLNAALAEGYHNALMKGRYPLACLFLELDPSEVDVNIHPAKREVKFHRERPVRQFVAGAVHGALQGWGSQGASTPPGGEASDASRLGSAAPTGRLPGRESSDTPVGSPAEPPELAQPGLPSGRQPASLDPGRLPPSLPWSTDHPPIPAESAPPGDAGTTSVSGEIANTGPCVEAAGPEPVPLLTVPLRLIGVLGRLYVVLESERGLVLLDQHAAHERVLYEQMLRRVEAGQSAPSQRLLLPETLEVSPRDAAFLRENLAVLSRLGIGLSEFGDRTFLLDALPPFVTVASPRRFAAELVDELRAAGAAVNAWRLGEPVVAKTVCRHAVKANDPLAGPELEALVADLRQCRMPYTCPHGRPTLIEMSFRELEKKFGRIQA